MKALLIFLSILFISFGLNAQKKYFEFNNPNAKRMNKKDRNLLISHNWEAYLIIDYIKDDTILTKIVGTLQYFDKGKYEFSDSEGTYEIIKNRYIKHSPNETLQKYGKKLFGGIYCIVEIDDTKLHLCKLQTSSSDMQRHLFFNAAQCNDETSEGVQSNYVSDKIIFENLTKKHLDSISKLTKEELFFEGIQLNNDSIIIPTTDSIYMIKWKGSR